jgi:hypothetical protein
MTRLSITLALSLSIAVALGCAAKHPAAAAVKPREIDFQDVLCTHQGDGLATCSCQNAEQVIDAKDPAHVLIRCFDGKRK